MAVMSSPAIFIDITADILACPSTTGTTVVVPAPRLICEHYIICLIMQDYGEYL